MFQSLFYLNSENSILNINLNLTISINQNNLK